MTMIPQSFQLRGYADRGHVRSHLLIVLDDLLSFKKFAPSSWYELMRQLRSLAADYVRTGDPVPQDITDALATEHPAADGCNAHTGRGLMSQKRDRDYCKAALS